MDDLKSIAFDYIRVSYEGKSFRTIAKGNRNSHFFGNKNIWESFRNKHFENIQPIYSSENEINFNSSDLERTLKSRDAEFTEKSEPFLSENLKEHEQLLYNQKHKDKPEKLIDKSINATNTAANNKNIQEPEVLGKVEELFQSTVDILCKNSPKRLFKKIFELLSSVNVSKHLKEKDELLEYIKDIEKEAYQLEKEIKHLK